MDNQKEDFNKVLMKLSYIVNSKTMNVLVKISNIVILVILISTLFILLMRW